jgi:hypothetical protein
MMDPNQHGKLSPELENVRSQTVFIGWIFIGLGFYFLWNTFRYDFVNEGVQLSQIGQFFLVDIFFVLAVGILFWGIHKKKKQLILIGSFFIFAPLVINEFYFKGSTQVGIYANGLFFGCTALIIGWASIRVLPWAIRLLPFYLYLYVFGITKSFFIFGFGGLKGFCFQIVFVVLVFVFFLKKLASQIFSNLNNGTWKFFGYVLLIAILIMFLESKYIRSFEAFKIPSLDKLRGRSLEKTNDIEGYGVFPFQFKFLTLKDYKLGIYKTDYVPGFRLNFWSMNCNDLLTSVEIIGRWRLKDIKDGLKKVRSPFFENFSLKSDYQFTKHLLVNRRGNSFIRGASSINIGGYSEYEKVYLMSVNGFQGIVFEEKFRVSSFYTKIQLFKDEKFIGEIGLRGKDQDSIQNFIASIKSNKPIYDSGETYYEEGKRFFDSGDFQSAARYLVSALYFEFENRKYHFWLGKAFYEVGNYSRARKRFEKVIGLDPNYSDGQRLLKEARSKRDRKSKNFKNCSSIKN